MALVEAVVRNAADTALLEEVVVEVACVLLLDLLVRGLAGVGRSAVLTKQVALPLVPTPALKDMAIVPAKSKKGEPLILGFVFPHQTHQININKDTDTFNSPSDPSLFIVRSALQVTQRVPPTCTTNTYAPGSRPTTGMVSCGGCCGGCCGGFGRRHVG
jgi:hypothetical protein